MHQTCHLKHKYSHGRDNVVAFRREGHDVVTKAIQNVLKENEEVAIWWHLGNEKMVKKSKYFIIYSWL